MRTMIVYRPSYDNEISWLNRVEATINNLRDPTQLRHDEYEEQLELLIVKTNIFSFFNTVPVYKF